MTDEDAPGFLARWSARKARSRGEEAADLDFSPLPPDAPPAGERLPPETSSGVTQPGDPPTGETWTGVISPVPAEPDGTDRPADGKPGLPDVADLSADSDYRGFLDRAVPRDIRIAALRKAWVTDPAIADYRPLADYDWDFNAPGYAALRPTDVPSRFVKALFRHLDPPEAPTDAGPADPAPPPIGDVDPEPAGGSGEIAGIATADLRGDLDPVLVAELPAEPAADAEENGRGEG